MFLDVLVDGEDVLCVDEAVVVDVAGAFARTILHVAIDGENILCVDEAVVVDIGCRGSLLWCREAYPSEAVGTGGVVLVGAG